MSDAYEIVYFRGKKFDRMTAQALSRMEERLGYPLTIMQGSYSGGVGASAGTHDGGGAVDLTAYDHVRKVRVGREIGWAMWYRSPSEGPWPAHVHGILIGNDRVSSGARQQVAAYKAGLNGLASSRSDTYGWRPNPIKAFAYQPDKRFAIDLHALRVDFLNVLDGKKNKPRWRGRVVQRLLNRKINAKLAVDGVIGPKTQEAWRRWERKIGVVGNPGVPNRSALRALFRWTIYFVKK